MRVWKQKKFWISSAFLIFGALTIISGGRSLFTEAGISSRGNVVPFILWFNFISGFFYIWTGVLTFKLLPRAKRFAIFIATLNTMALLYLFNHIFQGGLYEIRTLAAMSFRTLFWMAFALYFLKSNMFKTALQAC